MDERERAHLIKKLEEYSGAPIPVPELESDVELPKPVLERDDDVLGTVRLRFDVRGAPEDWADAFNRQVGGPAWPPGLPIPTLEAERIEVASLPVNDVPRYVKALRDYFAFTNRQVERQLPTNEARGGRAEGAAHRFDEEFRQAQRFIDSEFGPLRD